MVVASSTCTLNVVGVLVDYGRADEALRLIADTDNAALHSHLGHVGRLLVRLVRYGRVNNVLAVFDRYRSSGEEASSVGKMLTDSLIDLGRMDEAFDLLEKVAERDDGHQREGPWHGFGHQEWARERLADLLAQQQRTDELRQRANSGDPYASRRLADLQADQGQWEAALRELGSGARWARTWLAQRLAVAGQLNALRRLCEVGDTETREILVEELLAHDHVDEALKRLLSLYDKNAHRPPTDRLIDLLIKHGRVGEAVELLLRPEWRSEGPESWANFVDCMTTRGRSEEIIPLLRRLVASDGQAAFSIRSTLQKLLADQLAGQDQWAEALELLKDSGDWGQDWLSRQFGRLGRVDQLRHLADSGNHQARLELVNLLMNQGRAGEATAFLRAVADAPKRARDSWAARRLAELLAEQANFTELHIRIAKGDYDAARVLVEHAYRGRLPNTEQFLATGLAPDGSLDRS